LKVAFIGPWNFASGLSLAGRGYLSALWRTPWRLNIHAIEAPFHVHARLTPTISARDFEGSADIAIVHLNPDSWGLLDEAQRAVIERAQVRIGVWVWEMGHVPNSWRQNFGAVDEIWTPSRYCAEVFAVQTDLPVSVVPHVVPVPPEPAPGSRRAVLQGLGLDPDARLVLYAFDGASYLERKNPAALIRAFEASKLAERGWRLILKCKNLLDQPDESAALFRLATATAGVMLIDAQYSQDALAALFEAADIYASSHRSEGFGLTVAEAMALGKPVVATDYGGVRDFLDRSCGYPVPARTVELDEDLGAYGRGGFWGEVDEGAFARALVEAAERIEAGDVEIGQRARARIAERFSADAVAAAMTTAVDRALSRRPRRESAA
jgi:glycosyltransferase involved in cell wall biosynthesis